MTNCQDDHQRAQRDCITTWVVALYSVGGGKSLKGIFDGITVSGMIKSTWLSLTTQPTCSHFKVDHLRLCVQL